MEKRNWKSFLTDHAWGIAILSMLGCYFFFKNRLPFFFSECLLHRFLHLYCPLCGGTRAVAALLRLDLTEALRANGAVVCLLAVAFFGYARAWVRFLRVRQNPWRMPRTVGIIAIAGLLTFAVCRNLLLVLWGIDPLGDLLPFWS